MFKFTISFLHGAAIMRSTNQGGVSAMVPEEEVAVIQGPPTQPPRVRPPVHITTIFDQGPDRGVAGYLYTVGPIPDLE